MADISVSIVSGFCAPDADSQVVLSLCDEEYTPENEAKLMLKKASRYAQLYGVYFVPGRFIFRNYLCLCLIAPDGRLAGIQRAITLNLNFRGHLLRHDRLEPIDTPLGKIALLADVDINMPELVRRAAALGCDIIISSQYIHPCDYYEQRFLHAGVNAAASNLIPVAAAQAGMGLIVSSGGDVLVGPAEAPLECVVHLGCNANPDDFDVGWQLLKEHRHLFTENIERSQLV